MIIKIEPASPKPVYRQVIDQIKYAIASGRLREGDRLDPIRDVATATRINRNTIARAYQELEREGVIRSRAGQGSFVGGSGPAPHRGQSCRILAERIDELLTLAHQFRLDEDAVRALIDERLKKINLDKKT